MTLKVPVKRVLLSVYDKDGVVQLAKALHAAGVEIVSTGSTAAKVAEAGVPVTQVSEVAGFPECLDGRVKTLHPGVHAGLLADLQREEHRAQLDELGIAPFQLVVVNLYPFTETVTSGATPEECVEQIDIGGPAMVRASAKNHANVAVVVDPTSYSDVLETVQEGGFTLTQRRLLAGRAFAHTAEYDIAVASWFSNVLAPDESGFPTWLAGSWQRRDVLRYGENPHQPGALYVAGDGRGLASTNQSQGKQMSYNNFVDADAALRAAYDHRDPCVAIIKHSNPCGIAIDQDVAVAYQKAFATDPVSAFGGVVACNRTVTHEMAVAMLDVFTEVLVAPEVESGALEALSAKPNLRILTVSADFAESRVEYRPISGGVLLQQADQIDATGDDSENWQLACGDAVDEATMRDLQFAWKACRAVKSNAILLAKDGAAVGVGMGQVNRVDSAKLAVERAGEERATGAVAASDAFFPFPDGMEVLAEAGAKAIVQPGGSVRDDEVVARAKELGVTMYLTGTRHFFH